jgi:FMN phosphatase YigB (HAD superfamily)
MNLVFDLMDTLVPTPDPAQVIAAEWPDSPLQAEYFAAFVALNNEICRNGRDATQIEAIVREFTRGDPERTHGILRLIDRVPAHLRPEPQVEALFVALGSSGHARYILSNFTRPGYDTVVAAFPSLGQVDGALISTDVGLLKPEPAIFQVLLERFALVANETILIDDQEPNVIAARQVGLHALRYTAPARLVEDLAALGVHVIRPEGVSSAPAHAHE